MMQTVFDIGTHAGEDARRFRRAGFRVVAVDANADLIAALQREFEGDPDVTPLCAAVSDAPGVESFYVSGTFTQWSSLDEKTAGRDGGAVLPRRVPALTLDMLFSAFGTPHYLKLDIEGGEWRALCAMTSAMPEYVSLEVDHLKVSLEEVFAFFRGRGCRRYAWRAQRDNISRGFGERLDWRPLAEVTRPPSDWCDLFVSTREDAGADWGKADWSLLLRDGGDEERDTEGDLAEEEESFPVPSGAPPRILIGICSCRGNGAKRRAVRETWFPRGVPGVEARFFTGGAGLKGDPPEEPDTAVLEAPDDYIHLPGKVREFFRHALRRFEFDWLYKCDDDTYAAAERLPALCAGGEDLIGDGYLRRGGFAGGGAGYLLSRRFVERLAFDESLPFTGAEDVILTRAAIRAGARVRSTGRLQETWERGPEPDNARVSAHRCGPKMMHLLHTALHGAPLFETEAARPEGRRVRLTFYANGLFIRRGGRRGGGRWSFDPEGNRLLKWFDTAPGEECAELLTPEGVLLTEGDAQCPAAAGEAASHMPGEPLGVPATTSTFSP